MTIAQRFSVGNGMARELSPEGTAEMNPFRPQFSRPSGTWTSSLPNPTLKRWAIVMKSLRDMQLVIGNSLLIGHCSLVILWGLVIGHWTFPVAFSSACTFVTRSTSSGVVTPA